MGTRLTVEYDEVGDILYLDVGEPGLDQVMVEVSPGAMLRTEGVPGTVQGIEIHGFRRRATREDGISIPVGVDLRQLPATRS